MEAQIYVATHKPYQMPTNTIYQPIFVGAAINDEVVPSSYQLDNVSNNISLKNSNYNELTALYWIWKNCHADIKGIVQYRRYLAINPKQGLNGIINQSDIEKLLNKRDVIVPKRRHYYIETNYSHYIHAHHKAPLDAVRQIIMKNDPKYLSEYDHVMHQTSAHMFNMMIMPADKFDAYAKWLFSILFKVEDTIDISHYDAREARVFGYLSELLLDVWLQHNQLSCAEVPVMYREKQRICAKMYNMLKRKFFPKAIKRTHF